VSLRRGSVTPVELFVPPRFQKGLQLELNSPPPGISIQSMTPKRDGVYLFLRVAADAPQPELRGNLILDAFRQPALNPAAANQPAGKPARRQSLGTLPAIPFEIVDAAAVRK
jgi:hypothetical protein